MEELRADLETALGALIAPTRLVKIVLKDEVDADGDPVLRMRAVYDEENSDSKLLPKKVFAAYRVVYEVLSSRKDARFPLLTFVSQDEFIEAAA